MTVSLGCFLSLGSIFYALNCDHSIKNISYEGDPRLLGDYLGLVDFRV